MFKMKNDGRQRGITNSLISIYIICTHYHVYNFQLRIKSQSFENQQLIVAANFPFNPPIRVELINEITGLLESNGPNSNLSVTATARNSSHCISDSTFYLSGGVGEFQGSLCDVIDASVYLYFQCNSTSGLLLTNMTKPIQVTSDIHLAYFRPTNEEYTLNKKLEDFIQYVIVHVNNGQYGKYPFHYPLPGRSLRMKTYLYKAGDPSSSIQEYMNMKDFHHKYPKEKAYAIIGMNNNFASKTILPLLMEDEYAVTSYRKDVSSEFVKYPYFNRIHLSENYFMESVFLYLKKRKWTKVIFIYTKDDNEIDNVGFKHSAGRHGIMIIKYYINTNNENMEVMNYKSLFQSIIKSGLRIIITSVVGDIAKKLIMEANENNVTSIDKFQWIGLKNENHFNFILENEATQWENVEQNVGGKCNRYYGLINMRFKGMIFITAFYHVDVFNNSDFEYMWHGFLDTNKKLITSQTFNVDDYAKDIISYALAYDVLSTHLYAIKDLISAKKTANGISISKSIRDNTNFTGMTGKVSINHSTGNRDHFIGSIYIIWPEISYFAYLKTIDKIPSYNKWKEFGKQFLFKVILLERNDDTITEKKVLSYDLLNMLMQGENEEHMYKAHIPLNYWNQNCVSGKNMRINSTNRINITKCRGYFHDEYQMLIENPDKLQYHYNWYWPKQIDECQEEITEEDIPAPFYCEFGCGGEQNKDNINLFDNGECVAHNVCKCKSSKWHGHNCSMPLCQGCHPVHGFCTVPGVCNCSKGYMSSSCSVPVCVPVCYPGGGRCIKPDECECDRNHYGKFCNKNCICKNENKCNSGINGDGHCKECNSGNYGEDCGSSYIVMGASISTAVVILLFIIYMGVKLCKRELEFKAALISNDWIVNWIDVKTEDDVTGGGNMFLSAISMNCDIRLERKQLNIGIWEGIHVYYQKLDKDSVTLSKEIQLEIKQVRDMKHSNIVLLIGCSLDAPVAILTELQHKGSIADILANDDIKVPWNFRFHLMKDICKGLSFIQRSGIKSHGRLKSSNCLVDNKWTVKLSGFGLHEFRYGQKNVGAYIPGISSGIKVDGCDYESLLWTSPEILTTCVYHIDHVGCGTVNGDIYSFGMILSEFCTRSKPFSGLMLEKSEIINLISGVENVSSLKIWNDYIAKNNVEEGGWVRPCIQDKQWPPKYEVRERLKHLIENCWDEDPIKRLSIKECEIILHQLDPQHTEAMEQLVTTLEQYSTNLENVVHKRNKQLQQEIKKTENLVSFLLPRSVAEDLKQGKKVEPENFDNVTIYFSNIVGFSSFAKVNTPVVVVALLNEIYTLFDSVSAIYDVYKIDAVGNAYMLVSGLPECNGDNHVGEICTTALYLINSFGSFEIPHVKNNIQLQVGIHTGSVVAGVVGLKIPRYCLFGETIYIAVKMESIGKPSCIHITEDTFQVLNRIGDYVCEYRHEINIKSCILKTYWLRGKTDSDNPQDFK